MITIRIFINSVRREFAQERKALRDYLRNDPLMQRFFDVFLFEDVPASDRRPDAPRSPQQKCRLTDKGKTELSNLKSEDSV